jgi:hypothetical protein
MLPPRRSSHLQITIVVACIVVLLLTVNGWSPSNNRIDRRMVFQKSLTSFTSALVLVEQGPQKAQARDDGNAFYPSKDELILTEEERERQAVLKRMQERRQLMQVSRSTNSRQSYLELSKQRAAMYNTTYRGVSCPPNIPCL